jgi:hypothetical protein
MEYIPCCTSSFDEGGAYIGRDALKRYTNHFKPLRGMDKNEDATILLTCHILALRGCRKMSWDTRALLKKAHVPTAREPSVSVRDAIRPPCTV